MNGWIQCLTIFPIVMIGKARTELTQVEREGEKVFLSFLLLQLYSEIPLILFGLSNLDNYGLPCLLPQ